MQTFLSFTQIVISALLCLVILTQHRGAGLSATFGGGGGLYTSKRGAEKYLFIATIVLAILFVANSVAFLFV